MLPSNQRLLPVVLVIASLLVIQQLVYHMSGVLTPAAQIPEELRHLFSQDESLKLATRRLHLTGGSGARKQLPELPALGALKQQQQQQQQRRDGPASLAEKEEIVAVLQRLAILLSQERSRSALSEILESLHAAGRGQGIAGKHAAPAAPNTSHRREVPSPTPAQKATAPGKIPKILHQTFSSVRVHKNYQALIASCLRHNPDWRYYLWTDADADALMARHFPDMLKTVKLFKHNLEKSDALRYMVLHTMGGIYLDMDVECKKPFYPLLSNRTAFLDQEQPIHANLLYGRTFLASNSGMGASPGHPFFKLVLSKVAAEKKFGVPMYSTGPRMLSGALEEYRKSADFKKHPIDLLPHHVMSPEIDLSQNWQFYCDYHNQLKNAKNKLKEHKAKELSIQEEACLLLESQNWKMNDTRPETVAVHKFLHLGYPEVVLQRRVKLSCFNATQQFAQRIHFYALEQPLGPELKEAVEVVDSTH